MLIHRHVKRKGNKVFNHMDNVDTSMGTKIINDEPTFLQKEAFMASYLALVNEDMRTHNNNGPKYSIMALPHAP